ncbi:MULTISPECIES: efflux RND transporter periplasmic adaptor subunit [unclassified Duganella]|uniref:efflux RND transporter periplasmic adaptor subunit n=1 Tax=unclassified Duganella TaxID=2636909 RepID=UPI0008899BD3|nr:MULTISPECIES: efflux RND transporter periplasmic adaptor subunit [unclassified Duganella]SDF64060.1 RND family efflux transporter, MFP subunit [Duganella sp. OV458]SDI64454.1 RND family efflux transporter, MFP subunit [Duganella sp. OV510]
MTTLKKALLVAVVALMLAGIIAAQEGRGMPPAAAATARPALTVTVTQAKIASLPQRVQANGNIAAWQEASIGAEADGLRLTDVKVNVGDRVRRGQVLATFASATVGADLAHSRATYAEAEAALAEAAANAQRARGLQASGALSAQQINQYLTTERTAQARLDAAGALSQVQQLRLAQASVLAPDDGVVSARSATVGAVVPAGQELFRLIRRGRLEWRAEVAAPELARLNPGLVVWVTPAGGAPMQGKVRMTAPTVDPQTRNGVVYVDLPAASTARAGMFARGEIELGEARRGWALPQATVLQRDGYSYVMRLTADQRVEQVKVTPGQRIGGMVEIVAGLDGVSKVVADGGAFLDDGDLVRVVATGP